MQHLDNKKHLSVTCSNRFAHLKMGGFKQKGISPKLTHLNVNTKQQIKAEILDTYHILIFWS